MSNPLLQFVIIYWHFSFKFVFAAVIWKGFECVFTLINEKGKMEKQCDVPMKGEIEKTGWAFPNKCSVLGGW